MRWRRSLLPAAALAAFFAGPLPAGDWEIDTAHTTAQFSVRHMMISTVRGGFQKVTGSVSLDDKDLTHSTLDVSIDVNTIDTREPKRDAHLKSPDFFDTAKFATITFKSTKIDKAGSGYKVTGDLTMHGVTHPLTLAATLTDPVKNPWGKMVRGVSATGTLNRKDWGLTWNKTLETGGVLVGEEVELQIDGELDAKEAPAAQK